MNIKNIIKEEYDIFEDIENNNNEINIDNSIKKIRIIEDSL